MHIWLFSVFICLAPTLQTTCYVNISKKLSDLYSQYSTYASVVFLGDMNTQINCPRCLTANQSRVQNMYDFLHFTQMCSLNVLDSCLGPKYTFSPYTSGRNRTMIDHIIVSRSMVDMFTNCCVMREHELNTFDHLPVAVTLHVTPLCVKGLHSHQI